MAGGGGGGTNTNTVQSNNIPGEFSPLSQEYADSILYRARNGMPEYSGQRYANTNPYQQQSIEMTAQRAANGSPVTQAAQTQATQTLNGGFLGANLGSNQYLGQAAAQNSGSQYIPNLISANQADTIQAYNQAVRPQLDTAAARANAFGDNSGYREAQATNNYNLMKTLSNQANNIRYTAGEAQAGREQAQNQFNAGLAESALNRNTSLYNNERQRQIQGLLFAPQLAQADYTDASMLGNAGNQLQQYQQANLQNQYQNWYDAYRAPLQNALDMMAQGINTGRGLGGSSTSQSPYSSNLAGNLIGGGMLGLSAYNAYNSAAAAPAAYTAITYGAPAAYSQAASDAALAAAAQYGWVTI